MIDKTETANTEDEQTERHLPSLEVAKARMHLAMLRYKVLIDKIKEDEKEDTDANKSPDNNQQISIGRKITIIIDI